MIDVPIDIFLLASWLGGAAFALSGFIVGARKGLDIMGVFILSFLTANGGGMIRDVFIGQTPYALTDLTGFIIVVISFFLGLFILYRKRADIDQRELFVLSDAIGLAAFSLTGTLAGLEAELSVFGVVVLSFITATGGGILRDIMIGEVPAVFRSDFYGSVSILVAVILYLIDYFTVLDDLTILIVFLAALGLRLLAFRMKWHLPRLKL
ncbi:MAG: hypothetical protein CBB87_10765 [Micavibrio sp. TMED27]|nr:hypothetical protein [Micavibrio sp.]OUT90003.1 MAG: hypothetical protein CBB87_10765 [Micavibrio sp. TMED27]|tara:strand:- start:67 stop:693 length:627 start_codon:yes stop_codon:yes gene_type:complete